MTRMNTPIKNFTQSDLASLMKELGQPSFRSKQLYEWLYSKGAQSYEDMTNLPAKLRAQLSEEYPLYVPSVLEEAVSNDGTHKLLLEYHDGVCVETVAIPSRNGDRLTVCFSTQAGCPMACAFCATGKEGLTRNLTAGEIVDQIVTVQRLMGRRVTNVVGMGQGEPLLNYDNVLSALRIINDEKGLGIGARHICISTCGIIPGIDRFAEEPEQFTLAVSLHAARQDVRLELMPKTSGFPLPKLKQSLLRYIEKTNRRVTFEYIMIDGVNDTDVDLTALLDFCKGLLCHINLIPINSIPESPYRPSASKTIDKWIAETGRHGIETTLRDSRGSDIAGACGQLKNTFTNGQQ